MVVKIKKILLSFDLEEFDLPKEYNVNIKENDMFKISYDGCKKILIILDKYNIKGTFFVSAKFAEKYPNLIKRISKKHEIGLHCYEHKDNYSEMDERMTFERLNKAKKIIEKIINKKINGFRAPRFQVPSYKILAQLEILYDSSLLPIYIPLSFTYTLGRLKNLLKKRKVFFDKGVIEVPLSVTPIIRIPLLWITFRNMPLLYARICTNLSLINNNFVNLVFHPWEFISIKDYKIPFLIKRNTGEKLELKLEEYIKWCLKKKFMFMGMGNYLFKNL